MSMGCQWKRPPLTTLTKQGNTAFYNASLLIMLFSFCFLFLYLYFFQLVVNFLIFEFLLFLKYCHFCVLYFLGIFHYFLLTKKQKISRLNRLIYCEMIFTFLFYLNSLVAILSSGSTKTHYGANHIQVTNFVLFLNYKFIIHNLL